MIGLRKLNDIVMMNWMPTMAHSVTCQREVPAVSSCVLSGVGVWRGASVIRATVTRGGGIVEQRRVAWLACQAIASVSIAREEALMPAYICTTCGTQYPEADKAPPGCAICQEERQYVNPLGQAWTTLPAMRRTHFNCFRQHEPGLIGIGTMPAFAIGQRALLLRTAAGNILWDCISFIDDATVEIVRSLGGISAIAISHPHFYASMVAWSRAFGDAPIHLHAADRSG